MVSSVNGASIVKNLTSGTMDIQELAKNLTEATRAPRQALIDSQKTAAEAKISSIGKIQSTAKTFQDTLAQFGDARALALTPMSSDSSVADFSFKSYFAPSAVDFSFKVTQLATDNKAVFAKMPTAGMLNLGGTNITYTDLFDLRTKVNKVAGFTATIVNASDVVISKGTGVANNFSADVTATAKFAASGGAASATLTKIVGPGVLTLPDSTTVSYTDAANLVTKVNALNGSITAATPNANGDIVFTSSNVAETGTLSLKRSQTTNGVDATIEANGQTYSSSSNRFTNLINGVNVDVKKVSGIEVQLSTTRNTDTMVLAAKAIVDGYNSLLKSITAEIQYDPDVKKRGGLSNDFVARSFMSQLRSLTTQPITNYAGNGKTYTLADIGISTNRDGSWSLDSAKIETIAQDKPEILEAVISSDGNSQGIIDRMKKVTSTALDAKEAFQTLADRTKNTDLTKIDDQLKKLDEEMTALQNRYLTQFTAMQSTLYEAQNTQSSLTNFMTAWTAGMKNG